MGKLLESSNNVIVLDNLITGNKKNIDKFMDNINFKFIEHDIQDSLYIDENLDYIVHLASCASPKAYSQYPINTLKSGSIGTINALGIAKKHNAKFFLASTSEVYGDPQISPQDENYWGNVNTLGPRSFRWRRLRIVRAMAYSSKSERFSESTALRCR